MRHVPQRNTHDCGIATAAALAGVAYRDARYRRGDRDIGRCRGMYPDEMAALLEDLTGFPWQIGDVSWNLEVRDLAPRPLPTALLIGDPEDGKAPTHWIALGGQAVCDPAQDDAEPVTIYPRRRWRVGCCVFRMLAGTAGRSRRQRGRA